MSRMRTYYLIPTYQLKLITVLVLSMFAISACKEIKVGQGELISISHGTNINSSANSPLIVITSKVEGVYTLDNVLLSESELFDELGNDKFGSSPRPNIIFNLSYNLTDETSERLERKLSSQQYGEVYFTYCKNSKC